MKETFNYLFADLSKRRRFTKLQVRLLVEKYGSSRFGSSTLFLVMKLVDGF